MNTKFLPKAIQEYQKQFGNLESLNFNVHLRDKYGTAENLCKACLKANKPFQKLEPLLCKIKT